MVFKPGNWGTYFARKAAKSARSSFSGIKRRGNRSPNLFRTQVTTKTKFTYRVTNVIIYDYELHLFLNTKYTGTKMFGRPQLSPLWKALHSKGELAVAGAKQKVGVKTGALRKSIHMKHLGNRSGQYLWIGSKLPYAYLHHQGTKPHPIVAKNPGGELVFMRKSRLIRTPMVNHPGTRPNWYLRAQLRHFKTLV